MNDVPAISLFIVVILIIIYFAAKGAGGAPSGGTPAGQTCSPTNPTGTCEANGFVCSQNGTCVNAGQFPCSKQNVYGNCGIGLVCDSITGSPTEGTCIPSKTCGFAPTQDPVNGLCTDPTRPKCISGVCTATGACGLGPGLSPNGTCPAGQVCNAGTCGPILPCGPGDELPTPTTGPSGICTMPGQQCIRGTCVTPCGGGVCGAGKLCVGGNECQAVAPVKECTLDWGSTPGKTTCLENFPNCNGYVAGDTPLYGICQSYPNYCLKDTDCQNSSYPYGQCYNGQCGFPSQRPPNIPSNLTISLNGTTFDPPAYNSDNCKTCDPTLQGTMCNSWWPSPPIQPCGIYGSDFNEDTTLKKSTATALPDGFTQNCLCYTDISGYCWAGMDGYNTNNNVPTFYNCQ